MTQPKIDKELLESWNKPKFTECQSFATPIVSLTKMGGFWKRKGKERFWYPERLMVATQTSIYEWVPDEISIGFIPAKKMKKRG